MVKFQDNKINEWNMVDGYYDLLYRLIITYLDASITPGFGDDIEAFKKIVDIAQCKFSYDKRIYIRLRSYYKYHSSFTKKTDLDEHLDFLEWLDYKIGIIEKEMTDVMKKKKDNYQYTPTDFNKMSWAKRELRDLFRDVMSMLEAIGSFRKEIKIDTLKKTLEPKGEDDE